MRNKPIPKLVSWELRDEFGAGVAVIMAKYYLDPGVMEDTVQYQTVRKIKKVFVNMNHASVEKKGMAIIGVRDWNKLLTLGGSVYHGWCGRVQVGMHHWMGGGGEAPSEVKGNRPIGRRYLCADTAD
jgi:hypothetical protein